MLGAAVLLSNNLILEQKLTQISLLGINYLGQTD